MAKTKAPLRVGVDLTGIWRRPTGIFRYAAEVARHLLLLQETERSIRYVFFFAREIHPDFLPFQDAFDAVICPTTNELIIKQFWFPFVLPRLRLDVMHYPSFPPPYFQPFGPRTVMTLHDAGPWRYAHALTLHGRLYFRTLLARGTRTSTRVIAVSEHAKSEIAHFLGGRYLPKILVIPEAARPAFATLCSDSFKQEVRARYELPASYFFTVSTVEPRKNLVTLLDAYTRLKKKMGPTCPPLVIVGRKGWNCDDILGYMSDLQDSVRFPGHVSDEELIALYQMATCLVFPSLYEGFGLPVVEAMMAGCPVITSTTSSLPEVAGDAALLVDPLNADEIASAMQRLWEDEGLRDQMAQKGRSWSAHFTWEETAMMTRDAYLMAASCCDDPSGLPGNPDSKMDRPALAVHKATRRGKKEAYVAPIQMVHFQLIEMWEELLDVGPMGIRDNFFDLGGDSLLAARLIDRFEQVFKKNISLAVFCAGPTIEQLADVLTLREENGSRAPVVAIQSGGSRRPFFYLPGDWNNGAFYCYKLAHELGPDQPFYVVERYRFDGLRVLPTFEAMAAEYVASIRSIQPEGPYILGGFCHGALEAYEVARQLQAAGEAVDLLVLFDPGTPVPCKSMRDAISRFGTLIRCGQDRQLAVFLLLRHVRKHLRHRYRYLSDARYRRVLQGSEVPGTGAKSENEGDWYEMGLGLPRVESLIPTVEVLRKDWPALFLWVASGDEPLRFTGKTAIFWSKQEFPFREKWYEETDMKDIEVQVVPGGHMSCRTTQLSALAEHLRECLGKVQATESSPARGQPQGTESSPARGHPQGMPLP